MNLRLSLATSTSMNATADWDPMAHIATTRPVHSLIYSVVSMARRLKILPLGVAKGADGAWTQRQHAPTPVNGLGLIQYTGVPSRNQSNFKVSQFV